MDYCPTAVSLIQISSRNKSTLIFPQEKKPILRQTALADTKVETVQGIMSTLLCKIISAKQKKKKNFVG